MNAAANALRFAWRSRRTWWFTATARTRERYARTALGSFWLGLSNLLTIGVIAVVYGTVFKVVDFKSYVVYLGTGMVIWNTMAQAIQSAPNLFRANAGSIKNTNIHPAFYSLEEWAFQLQTFIQSFSLVLTALTFFQVTLSLHLLTTGILPLVNLLIFIYWFPLLICMLGVRFEDTYQLVPIVMQLTFLLTPILYKEEALGNIEWSIYINPFYYVLSDLRNALIYGEVNFVHVILLLAINSAGLLCSLWLLERQRRELPYLL